MGSDKDLRSRDPDELNTNRSGPLELVFALTDTDKEGNEIILQQKLPGDSMGQYLMCTSPDALKAFLELANILMRDSKRNVRIRILKPHGFLQVL